jgi:predicted kinase
MDNKDAILMFGLPAAGKTSYIYDNYLLNNHTLVCADTIKEGLPHYDKNKAHLVHQESVELAEKEVYNLADMGTNILMDGGGINNRYTLRIVNYLKDKGYKINIIFIDTPLETCLERNQARMDAGERFVPVDNIMDKHGKLERCLNNLRKVVDNIKKIEKEKV